MRSLFDLLREAYERWRDDRTIRLGAGVAYYGLFAVIPLATLSIALAQVVFSESEIKSFVENALTSVFGQGAAQAADSIVAKMESTGTTTGLGLFGIVSLIAATSILFVALQDAMNVIWGVPPTHGIGRVVRRYGLAYLVVLLAGSLLLGALAVQAIGGLAERLIPGEFALIKDLAGVISVVASWGLGVGLLAVLYRVLPQILVAWRIALMVAAVAAACLALTTWALGVYIQRAGSGSLVGAASTFVLATLWIYGNAQIVLAGAVMTRVLTEQSVPGGSVPG